MAGLAVARVEAVSFELVGTITALSVIAALLFRIYRSLLIAALLGIIWGSAALFWDAYRVAVDESWLTGSHQVTAQLEQVDRLPVYTRLRLIHVRRDDGIELPGKADVYLHGKERASPLLENQLVRASVTFHAPRNKLNPGAFDYRAYCFDRHIALIGSAKDIMVIGNETSLLGKIRQRIILSLPERDEASIIRALLLADRNHIPHPVQDAFAAAGAAHLLAISGLHVGMVAGWFFVITWWLSTRREAWIVGLPVRKVALSAGLLMAVAYATVAGWPLTAQRSVLMLAAAVLAWWLRSRSSPLNTMLAALVLVLLFDPAAVVSISLWLSFVAVAALLVWAGEESGKTAKKNASSWRTWATGLFWVSVVASVATLPIIADIFGRLPTYSLIANLLLVPLYAACVLPLSILGEMSAILGLGDIATRLFDFAATGIAYGNNLLAELQTWPFGNLWVADIPLSAGVLYGAGIVLAALFLTQRKYPWSLCCSAFSLLLYLIIVIPESDPESTLLTVWDVGQGAAATLSMPDGRVMVVDVPGSYGSRFNGGTDVAAGLREMGLAHADVLVLSHAQSDHAGGAKRLLEQLRYVGEVWLADVPANHGYRTMSDVSGRVTEQGGRVRWLKKGDRLAFGDAQVEVLWPPAGFEPENGNDASLVLSMRLTSGNTILFPADIEKTAEKRMLQQAMTHHDVMLVPHHGSRTSSTGAWVDAIHPDVAIAQSGWRNRYGFPNAGVMQRYRQRGSQLLDSKYGAVMIRFDHDSAQGMQIGQFQPETGGKRDTALQWWQRAL